MRKAVKISYLDECVWDVSAILFLFFKWNEIVVHGNKAKRAIDIIALCYHFLLISSRARLRIWEANSSCNIRCWLSFLWKKMSCDLCEACFRRELEPQATILYLACCPPCVTMSQVLWSNKIYYFANVSRDIRTFRRHKMKVLGRRQILWMTVMRVTSCLVLLVYVCAFLITTASASTPGSHKGIPVSRPETSAPEVYRSAKSENKNCLLF